MKMSLNQAAKTCGRAKSTISDAIKSGRLSASKDERGRYQIDTSELHRVFPFKITEQTEPDTNRTPKPEPNTSKNTDLEREVELLREMLEKSETNADHWRKMAERQQILLEDNRPKGFFQRILGK